MIRFWSYCERPQRVAILRMGLGVSLLYVAACHWPFAVELYSSFGPAMLMWNSAPLGPSEAGATALTNSSPLIGPDLWSSVWPVPTPGMAILLHTALLVALLAVTVGWWTRVSLALAIGLTICFGRLDLATTLTKYSVLAVHLMGLMLFARPGACWSVDAVTSHRDRCPLAPVWPRRLMQLVLCQIYLGAALTKLRSPTFGSGDLLLFSVLDQSWGGTELGMRLILLPHAPALLSLTTLLFELLYPFLIWVPRLRRAMIGAAILFHLSMLVFLHVGAFVPLMIVAQALFLTDGELNAIARGGQRCLGWLPGLFRRRPAPSTETFAAPRAARPSSALSRGAMSLALYVGCVALLIASGFAVQRSADWYHVWNAADRRLLPPAADLDFGIMRAGQKPSPGDYLHHVELGSRWSSTEMFGSATRFAHGQQVYVMTHWPLPHPELVLEGLLIDPEGDEIARFTHRVEAKTACAVDGFEMSPELPAGPYRVLLQVDGYEIAQRRFELRD